MVIWDNAPCQIVRVVTAHAEELGIEVINLPSFSPNLNPTERLWDGRRQEVTRGFCHESVAEWIETCQTFLARINSESIALVDWL